ncbi:hypothetical protein [Amycolatopsis saalfeldensis]|uniref:Uncharacterized protein n=1 Tax=Amycolatopsis saalfeldensis TaxID=394193 RepID=A0A1H8XVZ3_9PSEU|nr:hypothetical protein [Amycolatopsis saalfeldensis]SEP43931.1 hypothetical protein SAMN04489732_109137 [Amycolatopsis saalfeldensis]
MVEPRISFLGANTLTSGYECDLTYTVARSMVSTPKSKTKIDVSVTSVSCHL